MKRNIILLAAVLMSLMQALALGVHEIQSKHIASPAKVTVALPAEYGSQKSLPAYPVIYLLNGHGGDHTSWSKVIDLDSLATVYRTIIVCPAGLNSWYWDSPVDPTMKMESYIVDELVPWVDANFRTRPDRGSRAITGLSMGGHGGLWLGIRHSDLFGNAGSTSGGVDFRPFPGKWNIPDRLGSYDKNRQRWYEHTVMSLVDSLRPGQLNIIIDCGTEDFFYEVNNNLHQALKDRGIAHTYLTQPGAHNSNYWRRSIVPQMQFFRTQFYEP